MNKKLWNVLENASDVLEHYDNDPMVQDVLEQIDILRKIKQNADDLMDNEMTYSDELYLENRGEK